MWTLLRIPLEEARDRLVAVPENYVELFKHGNVSVEFYVPPEVDSQTPHDRDEIYIVASGSGTFVRGEEQTAFAAGDFLFVAAGVAHRFEDFTDDFATWVIFFS